MAGRPRTVSMRPEDAQTMREVHYSRQSQNSVMLSAVMGIFSVNTIRARRAEEEQRAADEERNRLELEARAADHAQALIEREIARRVEAISNGASEPPPFDPDSYDGPPEEAQVIAQAERAIHREVVRRVNAHANEYANRDPDATPQRRRDISQRARPSAAELRQESQTYAALVDAGELAFLPAGPQYPAPPMSFRPNIILDEGGQYEEELECSICRSHYANALTTCCNKSICWPCGMRIMLPDRGQGACPNCRNERAALTENLTPIDATRHPRLAELAQLRNNPRVGEAEEVSARVPIADPGESEPEDGESIDDSDGGSNGDHDEYEADGFVVEDDEPPQPPRPGTRRRRPTNREPRQRPRHEEPSRRPRSRRQITVRSSN